MKRVKTLVLCLASVVGVASFAVACTAEGDKKHEHTYATEWSKDAEGHWYDATCECVDVPVVKVAHVDANNDGACDICAFTDHEHTYAEGWTADCTNHWHAADCGHIVAGADLAAHADENSDGECDVCNYVIEDIHEHIYANEWSSDDQYHWYAAICEHKDQINGKEAHVINAAGDCTVCGKHISDVDATSIEDVLAAAQANNYKVNRGDVVASTEVWGGIGEGTLENGATDRVHFALGNGESYLQFTHFDKDGNFADQKEQWFESAGEDEVYGVELAYGEHELSPIAGDAKFLNGYNYIPGSVVPGTDTDTSTIANMLSALYSQMKAGERVSNAVENYDEATGKYTFAYTYYSVNVTTSGGVFDNIELELYNVKVAFTVNADMIIDWSEFEVQVYRDYEQDRDLAYTYEIGEDGATVTLTSDVTLSATANPSYYRYSVAQSAGERTFTTPYPRESLLPTGFNFYYVTEHEFPEAFLWVIHAEELIGDSLTVDEGEYSYFHLGDIMPITASTKFINSDDFTFTFVNNNPESTSKAWYMTPGSVDEMLNGYTASSGCLKLKMRDPGEYTVTIGFGNLTKTFTLTIVGEQAPELGEDSDTLINVATTDTYTYDVDVYSYTAKAEGYYTFNVPAGLGFQTKSSYDKNGAPEVDFYDNTNGDTVEIGLKANQTVEFHVAATTKDTWAITVDYVAGEVAGGGNEGGEGDDEGGESGAIVLANIVGTYSSGADALVINEDGTMTWTVGSTTYNYTITIDGNTVSYSLNGNASYTSDGMMAKYFGYINFGADGKPASFVHNGATHELTAGGGSVEPEQPAEPAAVVVGSNTLVFTAEEVSANTAVRTLTIETNGNFKLASNNLWVQKLTDANGNDIARNDDYSYTLTAGSYTITFGNLSMFGVQAGQNCTLNVTDVTPDAEAPEAVEATIVVGENNLTIAENTYIEATVSLMGEYTLSWDNANVTVKVGNEEIESGESIAFNPMGATLTIYGADYAAAELTLTLTAVGGDVGGETEEPAGYLSDGIVNEITVTDAELTKGYALYAFNVWTTGDYLFTSGDLAILSITDSEGNEVESVEWGIYSLTEGESYLVKINTGWVSNAGTYELSIEYQYPLGAQENPITLWDAGEYTANYAGNYAPAVWYTYTVSEDGVLTVSTNSETATVMLGMQGAGANESYGTATMNVLAGMTYVIGVAEFDAAEAVEITFTVAVTAGTYEGDGTANMPAMIGLGDVEVSAPEWDIAYYAYKATAAGMLTLTVDYENADWSVKVAGVEDAIYPEEGVITVEMYEGQVITISVSTVDGSAATYTINAAWKAAPTGVFEGVSIALGSNNLTIAENTYIQVDAQGFDTGDYTVTWSNENVIVKVDGVEFASGDTFYSYNVRYPVTFMVYGVNYAAVEVTLTIEKVVIPATPVVIGDNTVTVTDTYQGTTVEFTATEAGTYTFTAGTNAVLGYDYSNYLAGEFFEVEATEGQVIEFVVLTEDYSAGDVVVTIAKAGEVVEPEEPAQPDGTKENPFIVTELPYTITLTDKLDVYVQYTATEDCTLVITRTGGNVNDLPGNFENDIAAKTHTGTVTAGQVLLINFYAYSSKTYTISVAAPVEPEQPGTEEPEVPSGDYPTNHTGSGTTNDRYVILSLPYGITFEGKHDVYMQYTATEDCTLYITCPAGCYVSEMGASKDASGNYTVTLTAGQTLSLNPWNQGGTAPYTYTITKVVAEEPEEPEQGGETENSVKVWIGAAANGRKMKVEIDEEAGKMYITRSSSSGSFDGQAASEFSYSYDAASKTVSYAALGATSVTNVMFDESGAPTSVTYMGLAYTDYALQA